VIEYLDRGTDRLALHIHPEPDRPDAPLVLVNPAMGVPARYYRPLAEQLTRAGLAVVVADYRGHGGSTPLPGRRSRYGYADLAEDVGAVWQALAPRTAGRTRLLLGHSLGGQTGLLHTARHPSTVDGLVLVGVGLPYFRTYRRGAGVLCFTQAIVGVTELLGVWPGWGFGGRQARGVIRDWGYTARHGRFPARLDAGAGLRAMRTPVLAVSLENDRFTPAATMDHLVAMLDAAPVEREHHTAAQAGAPLDHFSWVRASAALADRVAAFATGVTAARPT
jgi:predicted alpha/beta hydrolase